MRSYCMEFSYCLGLYLFGVYESYYISYWLRKNCKRAQKNIRILEAKSLLWLTLYDISEAILCIPGKTGPLDQSTIVLNDLQQWNYLNFFNFTWLFNQEGTPNNLYYDENHQEITCKASYSVEGFISYENKLSCRPYRKDLFCVYVEE